MPKINFTEKQMKKKFLLIEMDLKKHKVGMILTGDDASVLLKKFR